jgi:hypothetical protein
MHLGFVGGLEEKEIRNLVDSAYKFIRFADKAI